MLQGEAREIAGELPLSANAVVVLKKRYLKKDEKGEPRRGPRRCSAGWPRPSPRSTGDYDPEADVDATAQKFYEMMASLSLHAQLPHPDERRPGAGPALRLLRPAGGGRHRVSIFDAVKHTALIHKSGGGTGFSFSRIRPDNDPVHVHQGRGLRPHLLHEHLRRGHRDHQAGRHPAGRQHGHPAGRPPGYRKVHHL